MDRIGPIKIGFTKDVGKRLISLSTANPYPLRLLVIEPGNIEMESEIHNDFRDYRLDGEWFLPHPKLLKYIEDVKRWNTINGFIEPDSRLDLGDWTLGGEKWKDHYACWERIKRQKWEKPHHQFAAMAREFSQYAILPYLNKEVT